MPTLFFLLLLAPALSGTDMEETAHLMEQVLVHIVDIRIQHFTLSIQGGDVVIRNTGGNQTTEALMQENLVARSTYLDAAVSLQTHRDDETVVLDEITMEGVMKLGALTLKNGESITLLARSVSVE